MADLNESTVKEEDVRMVKGDTLSATFPFDRAQTTARVAVFVDVKAEFCAEMSSQSREWGEGHTVVAQEELIVRASEHA